MVLADPGGGSSRLPLEGSMKHGKRCVPDWWGWGWGVLHLRSFRNIVDVRLHVPLQGSHGSLDELLDWWGLGAFSVRPHVPSRIVLGFTS